MFPVAVFDPTLCVSSGSPLCGAEAVLTGSLLASFVCCVWQSVVWMDWLVVWRDWCVVWRD